MHAIALDIGGANIKASDGVSRSVSRAFALWKHPAGLADELREILRQFDNADCIAVTMTGELADCFTTKVEGVDQILSAVQAAAGGRPVAVWQTGGELLSPWDARELTPLVAAANWHALATWTARLAPNGAALLIDVGSTTTDIIPLRDGLPDPTGRTDVERLLSGELLYLGIRRTPVAAIAAAAPFRGSECPFAAELFATTLDVWLLTGDLPEDPADCGTANGRPATRPAAHDRMARMLCCDRDEVSFAEIVDVARALAARACARVSAAIERVARALPGECSTVVTAGEGEFLSRLALAESTLSQTPCISLHAVLGNEHSRAACAFALARLSMEYSWPE